jgi:hypothetical protein
MVEPREPYYIGCFQEVQFLEPMKMELLPVATSKMDGLLFGKCAGCKEQLKYPFKKCARCKGVGYCGKECQKIHWKDGHNNTCEPVPDRNSYAAVSVNLVDGAPNALDNILVLLISTPTSDGGVYTTPGFYSELTLYLTIKTIDLPNLVLERVEIEMYVHDVARTIVKCTPLNTNAFLCMKHLPAGAYLVTHKQSALTKGPPTRWAEAMKAAGVVNP